MKKNILLATMLFGIAISAQAQDISRNAIGLRLGSNDGFGTEISYQARLSPMNRLELDLGWRSNNNEDNINNDLISPKKGAIIILLASVGILSTLKKSL